MLKLETRDDLFSLIMESERESLTLEFKAGAAIANEKKGEIGKDVSAMANAAGGQIIYGIKERDHAAADFQPVDVRRFNHEWLEKVIRNNIAPSVEGVTIKMIEVGPEPTDVAYVVSIPQATTLAPHQAKVDLKYYRRHNFMADPMADYEIREAINRIRSPSLVCDFAIFRPKAEGLMQGSEMCGLRVTLSNDAAEPALYTSLAVYFDENLQPSSIPPIFSRQATTLSHPEGPTLWAWKTELSVPKNFPIFREISMSVGDFVFTIPSHYSGSRLAFGYQIACPGFTDRRDFDLIRRPGRSSFTIERRQFDGQ